MIKLAKTGNETITIEANGHSLKLTHLDKFFWPSEAITKGDLLEYYQSVSDQILPYLTDRPESLNRFPNGIFGKHFYQKNIDGLAPEWARTVCISGERRHRDIKYLLCNDLPTLLFMVNLGCIEINPWCSRVGRLDYPDYLVIDLDPENISFDYVIKAALAVRNFLVELGVDSYPKTSGASGIHIYIPTDGQFSYGQVRRFAEIIARSVNQRVPDFTSVIRSPAKRQGKVYLDFLQNSRGQTLAAPYSVRPMSGATVSMPLLWDELSLGRLLPTDFTIKNALKRIGKNGDIFKPVLGKGIDLLDLLGKL